VRNSQERKTKGDAVSASRRVVKRVRQVSIEIESFLSRVQEDKEWHIDKSSIVIRTTWLRRVRGRGRATVVQASSTSFR
jgi:hypothetical protein